MMSGCSDANPTAELASTTSMYDAYCKKAMAKSQGSAPSTTKTSPASTKATTAAAAAAASEETTIAGTASRTMWQALVKGAPVSENGMICETPWK